MRRRCSRCRPAAPWCSTRTGWWRAPTARSTGDGDPERGRPRAAGRPRRSLPPGARPRAGRRHAHDDVALLVARLDAPPATLDLILRAEPGSLVAVRRALGRWLRASGVGDADAYEIQVACGEACSNAITHAYPPGEAHFAVRASRDGDELAIEVSDFGAWRPPRGGPGRPRASP